MQSQKRKLKVLVGQINSIHKDVDRNIERIKVSVSRYTAADEIDLFMLSEMALTGYTFTSKEDIQPFLEIAGQGKTFYFCQELAIKLKAYVICGYPEIDGDKLYNSAMIVDREGKLIQNYRKKHLYETDKPWASEGAAFSTLTITNTKGHQITASLAICMDLNCYEFKDNSQFEWAKHCLDNKVEALLFISAWNDHEPQNTSQSSQDGMMNYWLWRLRPLLDKGVKRSMVFVCADRCGTETGLKGEPTPFIGTSCVIRLNPVELIQHLSKKDEGYLLCETHL